MKRLKKVALYAGAVLVFFVLGFAVFVAARQDLRFDHELPPIHASTDPAVIARGQYVVRHLAGCGSCHADPARARDVLRGDDTVPLSGGHTWTIPPGTFRAYNITSDKETGIGALSDGQIARALRFGIGREGRALLPFMEMQGLSDEDLTAVVSYLRTQPAVKHAVPPHEVGLLGKVVKATLLANPLGPSEPPPVKTPHGPTPENGKYLAERVANCWACHTERSMKTGELTGPRFGGNRKMPDESEPKKRAWAPPNLTPDPKTGRTGLWSEEQFVQRFKQGSVFEFSPMPWNAFAKLDEDDVRAIYRYLKTLPPVVNEVGPPLIER